MLINELELINMYTDVNQCFKNLLIVILMIPTLDCSNIKVLAEIHMKKVKDLIKILTSLCKKISWLKL